MLSTPGNVIVTVACLAYLVSTAFRNITSSPAVEVAAGDGSAPVEPPPVAPGADHPNEVTA